MKKLILLLWVVCGIFSLQAENVKKVFQIEITDEIGPEVWRMVKKSFDKAATEQSDYIVIRMNTYGGMVVYADSLRTLILNSPRPVWVLIDNNAASAGALISIACDRIYMSEGANIGAATVVGQTGEAMPDKYQSYMRSMIRSTAQAHGCDTIIDGCDTTYRWRRDPAIAEAMVDQSLYVEGVSDSGRVVTFTAHEAIRHGFCDGIASNVAELLHGEGIEEYELSSYRATTIDNIIGFLINPAFRGFFILLIIGGLYFELQTPGVGFPLVVAIAGCLLYFAPLYLEGIAAWWEILLFLIGLILLLLEIFVIPGFGVTGISGIVCVLVALVMASIDDVSFEFPQGVVGSILKSTALVITSVTVALLLSFWLGARLITSPSGVFALHAEHKVSDGFVGVDMSLVQMIGRIGVAETVLRPSGKIRIDETVFDAVSELGDYITAQTQVKVVRFQAGQLYVVKNV